MMSNTIRLDLSALSLPSGAQLQDHPIVRAVGGHARTQEHNEIHYDTPDFALRHNDLTLTLNRRGKQWIQRCGIETPHEHCKKWVETPSSDNQLDLKAFKAIGRSVPSHVLTHFEKNAAEALAPVFTRHCREKQWALNFPDNVHIVLREEQGYLKFGATSQPFHELVLEHQSGDLARWFQTALELAYHFSPQEKTGLSLACATPVMRGFTWLDSSFVVPGAPSKAKYKSYRLLPEKFFSPLRFKLHAGMTIRQAFVSICTGLLQRIQTCRSILLHGEKQTQLEGIHGFHQALSQLHTLILLSHTLLPEDIRNEMDQEIRWLLKELDATLAWQAFLQETLAPLMAQFTTYPGLEALLDKAQEGQQMAIKRLVKALRTFRYTRLVLGMANWVEGRHWEFLSDAAQRESIALPVTDFSAEILRRYHNKLRKRGQKFAHMGLSARCGLQSDVDFMAHTTNLFVELFTKKRPPPFQTALARLQDNIHRLMDLHTSDRFFARLVDKREKTVGHIIQGWQGARTSRRLLDSTKEWEQFLSEPTFW